MATLLHSESRPLYSWWWDSHNSPKNSKWLQENLTDMDSNVKAMIKLIEEDADSFARRAEMYYKKRPELMKLVEEFYRAYRALAERYDQATGALRQAHCTMAEAFPNQIPPVLTDESPSGSSGIDVEPHTPEMPPPMRALYDPDDLEKDALGMSSNFHIIKRNRTYSEENDVLRRKGVKQSNTMFATGEGEAHAEFHEGRVRQGLYFHEEEGKGSENKLHDWSVDLHNQDLNRTEDVQNEIKILRETVAQLSIENQNLKRQKTLESERSDKAETDVRNLKDSRSKLNFERDDAIIKYKQSLEMISSMETQISRAHEEFKKLNGVIVMEAVKLGSAENRSLLLEKANQSLLVEMDTQEHKIKTLQEEHSQLSTENRIFKSQIALGSARAGKAESEVQSLKDSLSKLSFEKEAAILQYQQSVERVSSLEAQLSQTRDGFKKLSDEIVTEARKFSSSEERCLLLEKATQSLQLELDILEQKIKAHQEEHNQLLTENENLKSQITTESDRAGKAESEVQRVKYSLSEVNFEKEAVICQYHHSLERTSYLETQISRAQEDFKKLSDEMAAEATKLRSAEERCLLSEKANQSVQLELDTMEHKIRTHQKDFSQLSKVNENLERQIAVESEHADKAEIEVQSLNDNLKRLSFANGSSVLQKMSESERADKAEAEVKILKDSLSKLNSENASYILQYQQSLEKVSYLENKLSQAQHDLMKLNDEMIMEVMKLKLAGEQCFLLDKANQSKQLEVDTREKEKKAMEEEVNYQKLELEKVKTSLQNEHQQLIEAQMALIWMEKLHSQSQEELKLLGVETQCTVYKLKDVELRNVGLHEEICNLKEENSTLSKQNLSSALKLKDVQDEINLLKEIKGKLEDEMGLSLEGKKLLQQELEYLKDDKNGLEQMHQDLTAQMEMVRLDTESLHTSLKELQDEHVDLVEICNKHEEEKLLLLENLKYMEKISENNRVMENSLADANVELEELREKIKTLEFSLEALHGETSTHITEKAVLMSQVESTSQNMDKLMEKNDFLENSISVISLEVEELREKLKVIEESFQSLNVQKGNLIAERNTLVFQVDSISQRLESVESMHAELEVEHLNLEREKDLIVRQVLELESSLKLEKEEQEALSLSTKNQLATLEKQILVLREENQFKGEELEVEQQKVMSALIELFILHSYLTDTKNMILILSEDCQKHLEASRCAEKLVSQLQQEDLIQMEKIASLSQYNDKLKEGILLLLMALNINKECGSKDRAKDEVLLEIILGEVGNLLSNVSASQDEIQLLQIEMSVILTLLKQIGLHVEDMRTGKQLLEREYKIRKEEVLVLQCNNQELLERNEQLGQDVLISGNREEEMKAAIRALQWQLSDLQDAQRTAQTEIHKMLAENQSLSRELYSLKEENKVLEEENNVALAEAMTLEHLNLLFRSSNVEKAWELKLFNDDACFLFAVNNNLNQEIREMNEKMTVLEIERMHLNESVNCLEEYRNCLLILQFDLNTTKLFYEEMSDQIETGNNLLIQKELDLLETNQRVQSTQEQNRELRRNLESLSEEIYESMVVREELQKKIFNLSEGIAFRDEEIARISDANELLNDKLESLNSEVGDLQSREENLTSRLRKGIDEVDQCEIEITSLMKDIHIATVSASIFEEKVFELIIGSESLEICAMIQREVSNKGITSRNAYARELKEKLYELEEKNRGLKASLKTYMPLVMSLQDRIASLLEQTFSLAGHSTSNKQEIQEYPLVSHWQYAEGPLSEDPTTMVSIRVLELQKLIAKAGELQKVVTDTAALLEKERLDGNANLAAARKENEEIQVKRSTGQNIITLREGRGEHGTDHRLQKNDCGTSEMKHMQIMKDIQLDHVSTSSMYGNNVGPYGVLRSENSETGDLMLKLWEAAERDCNVQMQKGPPVLLEHDIEAVEEEKSEYPSSELVAEKKLSVDRLEMSSETRESHQEWSRKVIERLSSDAQRLSVLQSNVQELERKMENYEKSKHFKSLEYGTIKAKLKEAGGIVLELTAINSDLTKKVEDFLAPSNGTSGAQEETGRTGRMQIFECEQRGTEKIGRLELELQKIQYILLKLEEEHGIDRTKAADRGTKIILSEYLNERSNGAKLKKRTFCGCMRRPKTDDD